MTATQGSSCGPFSGNSNSFNTNITNNYGVQVPSYVPGMQPFIANVDFKLKLWLRICVASFEELIKCAGWGALPPEIDLDHLCDEYNLPGGNTGKWIFEQPVYRGWRESKGSSLLWLCGGPGTGKTMLAKRVAAEFLTGPDNQPERVKLVFHFASPELPTTAISTDETELSQLRLAKVTSDLLYGILQQDRNLFNGCKAELEKQGDRFFTNLCSLWKVLRKAVKDCGADPVYIIIDGVDGLKESLCKEFIGRILGLMEIHTVKIFLSSRDVPHVSNNIPCSLHPYTKINLDTSNLIKEDVESFIRRRVNAWGWDVDLKAKAMEALLAKSEGIFLWASLAIENLTYFSSGPDFDKFLRGPPSELQDVYREMLSTLISRGESGEVLNMIWSVALALRPLTFGELAHILACIEERAQSERPSCRRRKTDQIHLRTEKEIRIYVRSSLGFLRATPETVSIVHHTAIEYLFDEYSKGHLPVLSKSEADLALSWGCFRYLHHAFGDPERLPRSDIIGGHYGSRSSCLGQYCEERKQGETPWVVARKRPQEAAAQWPYLRYAAEFWFLHARRSIEFFEDKFCDDSAYNWFQHQFFEKSDAIRKPWIELCGDSRMEALVGEQTPLNIAVCLGLVPLVEKALSDFTKSAKGNRSPLHLAARFISGAYKILIAKGGLSLIDPDQDGNTPLHEAAISGHSSMLKAMVKKFGERKAYSKEINKKNHSGNTPLHLAFQFDHTEIVELLVQKGADTTVKNNAQMTAIELGATLERGDSLDILKHAEEMREETEKEVVEESIVEPLEESIPGTAEEGVSEPVEEGVGEPVEELEIPWASPAGSLLPHPPEIQLVDWMELLLARFPELRPSSPLGTPWVSTPERQLWSLQESWFLTPWEPWLSSLPESLSPSPPGSRSPSSPEPRLSYSQESWFLSPREPWLSGPQNLRLPEPCLAPQREPYVLSPRDPWLQSEWEPLFSWRELELWPSGPVEFLAALQAQIWRVELLEELPAEILVELPAELPAELWLRGSIELPAELPAELLPRGSIELPAELLAELLSRGSIEPPAELSERLRLLGGTGQNSYVSTLRQRKGVHSII